MTDKKNHSFDHESNEWMKKNSPQFYHDQINNSIIGHDYWEKPLEIDLDKIPPFPENIFPKWLEEYIEAVAEETQTAKDLSAMTTISVLSTALSKKFYVNPKGNWIEHVNTFIAIAQGSGNRKSEVYKQFIRPITEYENKEAKRLSSVVTDEETTLKMRKKRYEHLIASYGKKGDPELLEEAKLLADEIKKNEKNRTIIPQIITLDATPEKLVDILKEQKEKIALLSSEGNEVFEMISGRYTGVPNQEIYLKGYGNEQYIADRVGGGMKKLNAPSITMGLFVQQSVIRSLPQDFTNRGLTQRFLYSFPDSLLGKRKINTEVIPEKMKERYNDNVLSLLKFHPENSIKLTLSKEAVDFLNEQLEILEVELGQEDLLEGMVGWTSKLVGNLLRIAGVLHIAEQKDMTNLNEETEISLSTLEKVFRLKPYFIQHAKHAFGVMDNETKVNDLHYLLEKILLCAEEISMKISKNEREKINVHEISPIEISYRELTSRTRQRFKAQDLRRNLQMLDELYWIRFVDEKPKRVFLNPYALFSKC